MSKILIVDDEPSYREHLSLYLTAKGHSVQTASNGHEAIEAGIHYRPDVLVADWMLRDHIHGLHVASVLQALDPKIKSILITGFASPDLKAKANEQVFEFIEKPFEPERLEEALVKAAATQPGPNTESGIPVLETDNSGKILYANPGARELLAQIGGKKKASKLQDVFGSEVFAQIDATDQKWVEMPLGGEPLNTCSISSRKLGDHGRLFVLLKAEQQHYFRNHPIVEMLLESRPPAFPSWPFEGRALVVDDEQLVRRLVMTVFEHIGCLCHAAESHERGLQLFQRDTGIDYVILDYDMPGNIKSFIDNLQQERPGVTIVGTSGRDHRNDFAAVGVHKFLPKPWRIEDLITLLSR